MQRICGNPAPANGGQQCDGTTVETEICSTGIDCPVDGVWGSWSMRRIDYTAVHFISFSVFHQVLYQRV